MPTLRLSPVALALILAPPAPAAGPPPVAENVRRLALPVFAPPEGQVGQVAAAISGDGKTLVVCGPAEADRSRPGEPASRLVLVDLDALKVTAERLLPGRIGAVAVDAHFVYAGLGQGVSGLLVLDRTTLADKRRLATRPVTHLATFPGGLVMVGFGPGFGPAGHNHDCQVLLAPDLALVDPLPTTPAAPRTGEPYWLGGVWWEQGVLYDGKRERPLLASRPSGFLTVDWGGERRGGTYPQPARVTDQPDSQYQRPTGLVTGRWGVELSGPTGFPGVPTLVGPNERVIGRLEPAVDGPHEVKPGGGAVLLVGRPLAAVALTVGRWTAAAPWPRVYRTELAFHELVAGTAVGRVALPGEKEVDQDQSGSLRHYAHWVFARPTDELVVVSGSTLQLVPAAAVPAAPAIGPLRSDYRAPPTVAGGDQPVAVPLPAVNGGRSPLAYALVRPVPEAELDAATGKLRVTHPGRLADRLAPLAGRALAERMSHAYQSSPATSRAGGQIPRPATFAGQLERYAGQTAERFEKLTGRKPAGVPVWVPVEVTVRDADLATLRFDTGFFVDVPVGPVSSAAEADFKAFAPAAGRPPVQPSPSAPRVAPPAGELEVLTARVRALEARLDELTRKLDAALKALESQKPKDK